MLLNIETMCISCTYQLSVINIMCMHNTYMHNTYMHAHTHAYSCMQHMYTQLKSQAHCVICHRNEEIGASLHTNRNAHACMHHSGRTSPSFCSGGALLYLVRHM